MNAISTNVTRESLPMLIGVKDAMRMGITRNNFYSLSHRDSDIVVAIGDRLYLHRDHLLDWIDRCHQFQ